MAEDTAALSSLSVRAQEALSWARTLMPVDGVRLISEMPYGSVLQLASQGRQFYLKALAPGGQELVVAQGMRAAGIHAHVPDVIAMNEAQRCILFAAQGGHVLPSFGAEHLHLCLSAYAQLQRTSMRQLARFTALPGIGAKDILASFEALALPIERRCLEYGSALLPAAVGLEHTDLHSGNVIFNRDKVAVIVDWNDAVIAPLGLSLGTVYGSLAAVLAVARERRCPAFEAYARYWRDYFHIDDARLRRHLLTSAVLGSMRLASILHQEHRKSGARYDAFYLPRIAFVIDDIANALPLIEPVSKDVA